MCPVSAPTSTDITALKRRLTTALQHFRYEAELTQKAVANTLDWSESKVVRQEAGTVCPSVTDVRALLDCYGITDPATVERYAAMVRAIRARQPAEPPNSTRPVDRQGLRRIVDTLSATVAELSRITEE